MVALLYQKIQTMNQVRIINKIVVVTMVLMLSFCDIFAQIEPSARDFYQEGLSLHTAGNLTEAVHYYSASITLNPNQEEVLFNRALAYFDLEKYRKSLLDLNALLKLNDSDLDAYEHRGRTKYMLGDGRGAIKDYTYVLQHKPSNIIIVNRGMAYRLINDYESALADFDMGIRLDPNDEEAYAGKGDVLFEVKKYKLALDMYKKALALNPNDERVLNNKANTLLKLGDVYEASKYYDLAVASSPNSFTLTNRAFYNLETGELNKAQEDCEEATRLDYNNANAYYCLGLIQIAKKEFPNALENLNKAVSLDNANAQFLNKRGEVSCYLKNLKEAMADLNNAINLDPNLEEAYINRAVVYHIIGDISAAIKDQNKAIELGGSKPDALAKLAIYHNALENATGVETIDDEDDELIAYSDSYNKSDQQEQFYERSVDAFILNIPDENEDFLAWEIEPTQSTMNMTAGKDADLLRATDFESIIQKHKTAQLEQLEAEAFNYLSEGKYKDAEQAFNKLISETKEDHKAYNRRGLAKYHLKKYQKAIKDFSMAIDLDEDYAEAYFNRANAFFHLEEHEKAILDYNFVIDLNPAAFEAYYRRARCFTDLKDYEKAISDYDFYLKYNPENARVLNNRGTLKLITGNIFGANEDYDAGILIDSTISILYFNRADLKRTTGRYVEALTDYNKAIELQPQSSEAYYYRGLNKGKMSDLKGEILDLNHAIDLSNKVNPDYYFQRGVAYKRQKMIVEACDDFYIAGKLGHEKAHQMMTEYCNK